MLFTDHSLLAFVALGAYKNDRGVVVAVVSSFLEFCSESRKGFLAGEIEDLKNSVCPSVIGESNSSESLGPGSIPDLQFYPPIGDFHNPCLELHP